MVDAVNNPAHYTGTVINGVDVECVDVIRALLGPEATAVWCRGNAIKYLWRAGKKGSAGEDYAKAAKYCQWASEATKQANRPGE
jgi:hypothetical protein